MTPDTNTPRDLTDADIEAACGPCANSDMGRHLRADFIRSFRRVYDRLPARHRAADREARPASASVEAVRAETKQLVWNLRIKLIEQCINPSASNVRECDKADAALFAAIDRLAAASTPPAEAYDWQSPAAEWLHMKSREQESVNEAYPDHARCYPSWKHRVFDRRWLAEELEAIAANAEPWAYDPGLDMIRTGIVEKSLAPVFPAATPPASEARATGDAALKLADDLDAAVQIYPQVSEDDPGGYCTAVDQLMAEAAAELRRLAATGAAGEPQPTAVYVEARECQNCCHAGINDEHATDATCSECGWMGPSPGEDKCPACSRVGTMVVACPKCSHEYRLVVSAHVAAASLKAGEPQPREGWKWVPVEPTPAMIDAFHYEEGEGACNKWDAMLAAVPQADSGAAGGQGDKP